MQSARVMVSEVGVEREGEVGVMARHGRANLVDRQLFQ
jgi:hypothetical protein